MIEEAKFVQWWNMDDGYVVRDESGDLFHVSVKGEVNELEPCLWSPKPAVPPRLHLSIPNNITRVLFDIYNPFITPEEADRLREFTGNHLKACLPVDHVGDIEELDTSSDEVSCGQSILVIQLCFTTNMSQVRQAEELALAANASFLAVMVRYPEVLVGPCSNETYPYLYRQFYKRTLSASLAPYLTNASIGQPVLDGFASQLSECLKIVEGLSATRHYEPFSWSSSNLASGEAKNRWIIPWIDWPGYLIHEALPSLPVKALIDSEVGVVTQLRQIEHHQQLPKCVTTVQSDVADIRVISQWANNCVCQGSEINNWEGASNAAIGEAIERYCINILDFDRILVGSSNDLTQAGYSPCDPRSFVLFSEEQYARYNFGFVPFTEDTVVPWIDGTLVGDESKSCLVPTSMVYVNYNHAGSIQGVPITDYPRISPVPYAGVAAGCEDYDPVLNGLEEIIERDATMIWWHSKPTIDPVAIDNEEITRLVSQFEAKGFNVKFFLLPNEFRVPVVAASLTHDGFDTCNIGFSCRPRIVDAAKKALTEAATLFEGTVDLLDPNGRLYEAIRKQELSEKMALKWRSDRCYLDSINWDFSVVKDLMIQQHINLDPAAKTYRAGHLERETVDINSDWVEQSDIRSVDYYLARLRSRGYEAISVDVTTPDVRMCGWKVVRVLVPGLVPNFAAGQIMLGHSRIQRAYYDLGLLKQPQNLSELNYFPLPHA
ncbi:YcaO-like family protein [Mobiluncus mulieris]|uniref:YcaO domain-containing protein n=1 Tax=Mobiluncus mulieris TaxID=2052 RepID=A0A7Y0UVF4_9ACTO|nr:hypothetical protein [Mobiluncus mulieris]NMX12526.1 hypothetical protein [Mobiluncus mulieris]